MEKLLVFAALVLSFATASAQSTMAMPVASANGSTSMTAPSQELTLDGEPTWEVRVGTSTMTADSYGGDMKGKGLAVGARWEVLPTFSIGGEYANYKMDITGGSTSIRDGMHTLSGFGELAPIRYDYEQIAFRGSILGGLMQQLPEASASGISKDTGFFYGAGLTLSFNHQIGVRLDLRQGDNHSASTLSMTGYY